MDYLSKLTPNDVSMVSICNDVSMVSVASTVRAENIIGNDVSMKSVCDDEPIENIICPPDSEHELCFHAYSENDCLFVRTSTPIHFVNCLVADESFDESLTYPDYHYGFQCI
jgi:hypothetical protein